MAVSTAISRLKSAYAEWTLLSIAQRLAWVFLALFLALVFADALFAFAGGMRALLGLGALASLVTLAAISYARAFMSPALDRMVARLMEEGDPAYENTLINALDFEKRLASDDVEAAGRDLMEREIARADSRAQAMEDFDALRPKTFFVERRALLGAVVGTLVLFLLFSSVFIAVVPRLLFPWADFPPYSATKLAVDPGAIEVNFDENLKVSVTASGAMPESVELVLWDANGAELAAMPMFHAGEGDYFQTIEQIQDDVRYFARTSDARSKRFPITVIKRPRVEDVIVALTYPAYTGMEPERRMLTDGIVRAYPGTEVDIVVTSNRPLGAGTLHLYGGTRAMTGNEEGAAVAHFTVELAGPFSIDIVDTEGNASENAVEGLLEIIPDAPPEIAITAPGMDSFALPNAEVPIEITALDDLGIAQVALFRNHNNSVDSKKVVFESDRGEDGITVTETLDMADLGVRPGDMIEYYATAIDNKPGSPQSAASPAFRLAIISEQEYRDFMQTQMTAEDLNEKYDAILAAMEEIADAQRKLAEETAALEEQLAAAEAAGEPTDELNEQIAAKQAEQAALADKAEELAKRLEEEAAAPAVFDIEEAYKEMLQEFANRLGSAAEQMRAAQQKMGEAGAQRPPGAQGTPSQSLSKAREKQDLAQEELDQNTQDFQESIGAANENLEHVMDVVGDVELFKYLYTLQKGLERQIRYYEDKSEPTLDDQVRLKDLSAQQDEVRAQLTELRENLRLHADALDELAEEQVEEEAAEPEEPAVETSESEPEFEENTP